MVQPKARGVAQQESLAQKRAAAAQDIELNTVSS